MIPNLPTLAPKPVKVAIAAAEKKVNKLNKPLLHSDWIGIYRKLSMFYMFYYKDYDKNFYTMEALDAFEAWCKTLEEN